jgi:leader peptidase (prepilin peptidase)/N-methyltransferase
VDQAHTGGYIVAFVLGTVLGSFANVCIHRLPRRQSVVFPASHCPYCQQRLRPWHNLPLLSYVALGGRCATCRTSISWRYPLVELLCGLLYVFLYHQWGVSVPSVVFALFATALLIVSFIDLEYTIIPDAITLPGIVAGLLASLWLTPVGIGNAVLGVLLGGGAFSLIVILSAGRGMGAGDIKLIAMIGAFLGWQAVLVTIFLGASLGTVVGLSLMLLKRKRRKDPIPFGPFLALGALLTMVWGEELLDWYLHLSA